MVRSAEQLLDRLVASQVYKQDPGGEMFLDALIDIADKILGTGEEASASFLSIQLFCSLVSKEMQAGVWAALKAYGCLEESQPEVSQLQQSTSLHFGQSILGLPACCSFNKVCRDKLYLCIMFDQLCRALFCGAQCMMY